MNDKSYCGYVAIVGRPNVGKSTLLNQIIGQKITITARKPQTTRNQIIGIKTTEPYQAIYVDTPGFHVGKKIPLNKFMLQEIDNALAAVDLVIFVIEALKWRDEDELVLQKILNLQCPVILAINKTDRVKDKKELLPFISHLTEQQQFAEIIPISAKTGINVPELELAINKLLPESPFYFDSEQITDRSERFLVAELIREKLTRLLGQELPHELTVTIDKFAPREGTSKKVIHIAATIYVEKPGQKVIIIGKKGEKLKEIGKKARLDIQELLQSKVFLQLWVKVKSGWSSDDKSLQEFGYL